MRYFIISFLFFASNLFAQDNIIVSIRPLQSIVANLTDGVSEPKLIIDHNESLHHYHPKFQVINNIYNSNFIVIIDRNFEVFMDKITEGLKDQQKLIEVAKLPGVKLIENMENDHHHHEEEHEHEHEGCSHTALKYDYHLWLDVDVVKNIAKDIVDILSKNNPDYKEKYHANLDKLLVRLDSLDKSIKEKLISSRNKNYIAVHNAYKYFAKRYHLNDAIPVTIDHDSNVGAQTMLDLRRLVADHEVVCLFQEPQFDVKIIDSLAKDSDAKIGKVDAEWGPEEADIKDAYFDMMNNLAESFKQCLN